MSLSYVILMSPVLILFFPMKSTSPKLENKQAQAMQTKAACSYIM